MSALNDPGTPSSPRLAAAFLALTDVDPLPAARFAPPAALAALATSLLLALSGPLAWLSRPVVRLADQPAATVASKAPAAPGLDDDAGDG